MLVPLQFVRLTTTLWIKACVHLFCGTDWLHCLFVFGRIRMRSQSTYSVVWNRKVTFAETTSRRRFIVRAFRHPLVTFLPINTVRAQPSGLFRWHSTSMCIAHWVNISRRTYNPCDKILGLSSWAKINVTMSHVSRDDVATCRRVVIFSTWSMIVKNPTIILDHDRDLFEKNIRSCVTQCPHTGVRTHTC